MKTHVLKCHVDKMMEVQVFEAGKIAIFIAGVFSLLLIAL